jgi:RNA polymerase sigma factor (sigma-70 family)
MTLLRAGQEEALGVLMRRHGTDLMRFFRVRSADPHASLDLANETFYRVFTKAGTFEPSKPFRPWLFAVAMNVWRAWLRRRRPPEVPLDRIPESVLPGEGAGPPDDADRLEGILESLSPTDRDILTLRHYEGLKLKEVARRLGLTPGAVYTRLFRILEKLRRPGSAGE